MRVRFFAYIRNFTGCAEAELPYQETAGALARSLCERYGDKLRQKIFPSENSAFAETPGCAKMKGVAKTLTEEKFGPEVIFLINGRHVSHLGGVNAPLKPDDRVDLFPVVAGG